MKEFHLRPAKPEDAPALSEIYRYYVENTAVSYEWKAPTPEEFSLRIETTLKKYPYYVAEDKQRILGYAYAGSFSPRTAADWTAEVSIYVHRDCRRGGVGKALYAKLEETLKAQNIQNLVAKVACCDRAEDPYLSHDSIDFHQHCGFQKLGAVEKCGYKFGRWYGLLFMQKCIGAYPDNAAGVIPYPLLLQ